MSFISLHGAYFPNNYGDVLILNIEADWIKEITNEKVSLPYATDIYRKTLSSNEKTGKESIIESDYLILGAGGFLGEPPFNKQRWAINFVKNHLKPTLIAKRHGIPYSIIGTGAGPMTTFLGRKSLKYIVHNAETIAVRDIESKKYIEELIDYSKEVLVTADVALSLTKESIPEEYINKVNQKYLDFGGIKIGIHIGADRHSKVSGGRIQLIIDETIDFLNNNTNYTPVLIIDNDNNIQREAVDYLKNNLNRTPVIYKHKDIWETTALLAELDTVITNKLHIGIVNYAMGNIPISFPYHSKTKRFYKQIDLEHLCTPIEDVVEGTTSSLLNTITNDISLGKKENYQTKRDEMYEKALLNKKILEKILHQ